MPELPEIEHLKRTLEQAVLGAHINRATLHRRDVLRCQSGSGRGIGGALLAAQRIAGFARHGKQLAIIGSEGFVICVHLGMSGQLRFLSAGESPPCSSHIHCTWTLNGPNGSGRLIFRDPRRFGGLWCFPSVERLHHARWSRLGPDALTIRPSILEMLLHERVRPIKAALLDQSLIAGVGNIYADEALFDSGIHPLSPSGKLHPIAVRRLAMSLRRVLFHAVQAGGTTLRDYADAAGQAGWFAVKHKVYGRKGRPCVKCQHPLSSLVVAQRTTVCCERCQPRLTTIPNGKLNGSFNR